MNTRSAVLWPVYSAALCGVLWGCAGEQAAAPAEASPGTLAYDQAIFHSLLENHASIRREVKILPNGAEATTESDDPQIAAKLYEHVTAMKGRLHDGRRVRQWDPLYVAMFDEAKHVDLEITRTDKGIRVLETSKDPYVAELIKKHAAAVSGFANEGFPESAREHPVPARP